MSTPLASVRAIFSQPDFGGLLASTFALGVAFSFVAPFLSTWGTEEIGLSPKAFGVFMTATSLCAIVASTALARWSDTLFSRKHMLILGSLGGALGFAGYATLRDPFLLAAIGCTLHAVASICFAQLFSHVRETFNLAPTPAAAPASFLMSVVRVCFSFSWTLGPAVGSLVLLHYGFRGLFLAAAGLYLVFLLGILLYVPQRKPTPQAPSAPRPSLLATLREPKLLACFAAFAAVFAANAVNMMNLPLAITRTLGGDKSDFGIVFGIGPLVEIPLMLWFGHLAGRGHQLRLIRIGFAITLLYFLALYFATEPWHVYCIQILSGASFAILTNVAILFFQDLVPGQLGLATSLFANAGAAGNLVGLLSFGFAIEALGHRQTFLACAAVTLLAGLLVLTYRETPPKAPPPHA